MKHVTFNGADFRNNYFSHKARPLLSYKEYPVWLVFTTCMVQSTTLRGVPEGSAKLPHSDVMPLRNDGCVLLLLSLWQQAGMGKENTLMYSLLSLLPNRNDGLLNVIPGSLITE